MNKFHIRSATFFLKKKTDKQTMITYIYTDFRSFSPILNGTEKSVFFFKISCKKNIFRDV